MHVVLEVFEVVTHQVGDDAVLLCQLVLQLLDTTLGGMELLLKSLDSSQLFGLHNHHIVHTVHSIFSLLKSVSYSYSYEYQYYTYGHLYIGHGMVYCSPHHSDQLLTGVDDIRTWSLVVTLIPLLHGSLHLCCVVRSQGQALEMMMSGNGPGLDKVLERKTVKSPE